jgi:hypothetical protein
LTPRQKSTAIAAQSAGAGVPDLSAGRDLLQRNKNP